MTATTPPRGRLAADFDAAAGVVFAHEGAWSCDPCDPGGATHMGITLALSTNAAGAAFPRPNSYPAKSVTVGRPIGACGHGPFRGPGRSPRTVQARRRGGLRVHAADAIDSAAQPRTENPTVSSGARAPAARA